MRRQLVLLITTASIGLFVPSEANATEMRYCFATKNIAVFDTEKLIAAAQKAKTSGDERKTTLDVFGARNCDVLAGQYVAIRVTGEPFVAITSKSCSGLAIAAAAFASTDCK